MRVEFVPVCYVMCVMCVVCDVCDARDVCDVCDACDVCDVCDARDVCDACDTCDVCDVCDACVECDECDTHCDFLSLISSRFLCLSHRMPGVTRLEELPTRTWQLSEMYVVDSPHKQCRQLCVCGVLYKCAKVSRCMYVRFAYLSNHTV